MGSNNPDKLLVALPWKEGVQIILSFTFVDLRC